MKYDDLINAPYKVHGRGNGGYDCYGLVIECCKRSGTPLRDMYYDVKKLEIDRLNDYISGGLNIRKIDKPVTGCLVEMEYKGDLHAGFLVDRNIILHATYNGVKTSTPAAVKIHAYYEVINESDIIQNTIESADNKNSTGASAGL